MSIKNLLSYAAAPVAMLALAMATPAQADDLRDAVTADMPSLLEIYRYLHANPELSFQEFRTAAKLAEEARRLGFTVTEKVGQTGVVAVMENGPGPVVMLRADMDGLPVEEQTGLPFASKAIATTSKGIESPVMHACGHDTHMTAWVGTARQLVARKDEWSGTLVMILQPAEEIGSGAKAMLEDGLYERFPKPEYVMGFHDAAQIPAGMIGYKPGYALANVDSVSIKVKGIGGHGAYPSTAKDPVVLGSQIVMALQTLVSREIDPQDPAVVTVGSFRAGAKHNIISDEASLLITVRSYSDETRQTLIDGIARIARGQAIAAGLPEELMPEVTMDDDFTPSVYNSPEFTEEMATLFKTRFGDQHVLETPAVMGGEDFSRFRRADPDNIKSMIFWVGGVPLEKFDAANGDASKLPSLHSPFWTPDAEKVVATATEAMTAATLKLMAK
ncbi:amidohydrolase [Alterisphingorhabdus coralli]|uniref:Amidohydrolase n=1 Tax=Alterisphingorhabdus coralli TaxID=3071408 RepID=A0AA97F9A7_9SPHN|nr:amidohydrolase [Parasphingorhabdus sp. SCSIO 66989]WOE76511.1 amidohydrolase [Parasphingorhabdus sp. SCSIO 66989]